MVSFQCLPLPVLNPGWSLQSPQGSQKILIIPRDPHPKIKITQSKTATVHHTKPSKKDFIPAGADSAHTARYASQHPEGFLFFLCLSWALYSEPDAGTSKAARNDFPGTAKGVLSEGTCSQSLGRGDRERPPGSISPHGWPSVPPTSLDLGAPGLSPQTQQTPRVGLAHVSAIPRTELFTNLRQRARVPAAQVATVM